MTNKSYRDSIKQIRLCVSFAESAYPLQLTCAGNANILSYKIADILGIQDGSGQASKARPNGSCAVADWWSEFQKAKKLAGWQSLLKGMGVAAEAADGIDCLTDVLPFLIDALDTLKACKKPRRFS